jgi:hypothetical protein
VLQRVTLPIVRRAAPKRIERRQSGQLGSLGRPPSELPFNEPIRRVQRDSEIDSEGDHITGLPNSEVSGSREQGIIDHVEPPAKIKWKRLAAPVILGVLSIVAALVKAWQ